MKKLSRMEASKEVRRILVKNSVDLSLAQYLVAGYEIRLSGWLIRIDQMDFTPKQVEIMIEEFQRRLPQYMLIGDMDNWNFTAAYITYLGDPRDQDDDQEKETIILNSDLIDLDYGSS